jgi:hypothetical protein
MSPARSAACDAIQTPDAAKGGDRTGHRPRQIRAPCGTQLAGQTRDAINAAFAAVGDNFRRLLAWFSLLLAAMWIALAALNRSQNVLPAA